MKILQQASCQNSKATRTRGVSHGGLAIYFEKKSILRQKKEELWKLKYFTMSKI
jgi:hypothetical protein